MRAGMSIVVAHQKWQGSVDVLAKFVVHTGGLSAANGQVDIRELTERTRW
jgi:hypothetical protein